MVDFGALFGTTIKAGPFETVGWMNRSTVYLWAKTGHYAQRDDVKVSSHVDMFVQLRSTTFRSHIIIRA